MAAYSGCGERDGGERTRQEALAPGGAGWRGRWVGRLMGQWRTGGVRLGVEWLATGPRHESTSAFLYCSSISMERGICMSSAILYLAGLMIVT